MAQSVHLVLEAGDGTIAGESTVTSHGRENTIECVAYAEASSVDEEGAGLDEVSFDKRIDASTPRLAKALFEGEELKATFRFYRSSMTSDGTVDQYFTVTLGGVKILEIRRISPDSSDPDDAMKPALERVTLGAGSIEWAYGDQKFGIGES